LTLLGYDIDVVVKARKEPETGSIQVKR
jgi:hypothetical protein